MEKKIAPLRKVYSFGGFVICSHQFSIRNGCGKTSCLEIHSKVDFSNLGGWWVIREDEWRKRGGNEVSNAYKVRNLAPDFNPKVHYKEELVGLNLTEMSKEAMPFTPASTPQIE